jgi:uncharacterized MAPEG superfamily protein
MQTLIICLFIAALLPLLAKAPLAVSMHRNKGGYDNKHPRDQQARLTGFGARALAAHQNAFEALLMFAVAAITALATNNVTPEVEMAAMVFVVARVLYNICYLVNQDILRSITWLVGIVSSFYILYQCVG